MLELNKIYCGDCLEIMRQIPDKSIDLVLTDPPYGLGEKMHQGGTWAVNPIYDAVPEWDLIVSPEYFEQIFRVSKNQIIWGGHLYVLPLSRCWLVWNKKSQMPTMGDFEMAWTSFDAVSKMYTENRNPDGTRQHPTQKPLSLFRWCIEKYSDGGQTILDPFLGSGTTAIACKQTNHNCIGIEISPEYCAIAEKRLAKTYYNEEMFG